MASTGEAAALQAPIFNRLRDYLSGDVQDNGRCAGDRYCMIRFRQWINEQKPSSHQIRIAKNIFDEYVDGLGMGKKRARTHRRSTHRRSTQRPRNHRRRTHRSHKKRKKSRKR